MQRRERPDHDFAMAFPTITRLSLQSIVITLPQVIIVPTTATSRDSGAIGLGGLEERRKGDPA